MMTQLLLGSTKFEILFVSHPQFTWFINLFTLMMDTEIDDQQETQQRVCNY